MSVVEPSDTPSLSGDGPPDAREERVFSVPMLCLVAFFIGIVAAIGAVFFRYLISVVHNLFYYGKFSTVYLATRTSDGLTVALKKIKLIQEVSY